MDDLKKKIKVFIAVLGLIFIAIPAIITFARIIFSGTSGKIIFWLLLLLFIGLLFDTCFHTGLFLKEE